MRTFPFPVRSLLAVIAPVLFMTTAAVAVPLHIPSSAAGSVQQLTAPRTSQFADAEIPPAMRNARIPGAVFVVARGDRVICEKAYGVADLETGQPVSPDKTLFRVASISKILTAASALQLVDAHKLDLHRNINRYLTAFHITPSFGQPITLANLLTHSSGFDDCQFDYAARSLADKLSLRNYLAEHQPARIRPPGLFSVYDNYGYTLAGYLVQKASGIPFADYVQDRILNPLDMEHSSFSPDAALRKHLATGYWLDGETPRACGRSYVNIMPAAGFCTTASDMSEFLVALLADRAPDGSKIFPASVISGLETRQFGFNAELPGRCYGFDRISIAGRTALRQTGQWPGFNSVLLLFPKQHCGVFLAYNLCDYFGAGQRISRQFAECFIPPDLKTAIAGTPDPPAGDSFEPLLGAYLSARSAHDTPELNLPREIDVTRSPDGHLEVDGQPYREIEPLVFEKIGPGDSAAAQSGIRVAFRAGREGNVTHLITQSGAYRHAAWIESDRGRVALMRAVTIVFLSAVVLWPIMVLMRLIFANAPQRKANQSAGRLANFSLAARGTALAACGLALWFETSFAIAKLRLKPFADFYGFPAALRHLLWALPVLLVLMFALAFFSIAAWRLRLWNAAHRLHFTLMTGAFVLFLYVFYSRHLLFAS